MPGEVKEMEGEEGEIVGGDEESTEPFQRVGGAERGGIER